MPIASWHVIPSPEGVRLALRAHLHGRDAEVHARAGERRWHWRVLSPGGHVLAEGRADDRDAAQDAAESEILAVHPPTERMIDGLID
jgi:hypothetical protein